MSKRFSFWIWGTIITQILTAAFHSVSFFVKPQPENETEKQMVDLITNYKQDAGMGFHPTFLNLVTGLSIGFALLFIFGASLNLYFKKKNLQPDLWKGLMLIETLIFGGLFAGTLIFTFALPVICSGLVFVFVLGAYLSAQKNY